MSINPSAFARMRISCVYLLPPLGMAIGACSSVPEPPHTFSEAPDDVIASFTSFIEERWSTIEGAIQAGGYHLGDTPREDLEGERPDPFVMRVSSVRDDWSEAELYEAGLRIIAHYYPDGPESFAIPKFLWLEFATRGNEGKWILLTDNGYLYNMAEAGQENVDRLPFDLVAGLRNAFKDRAEVGAWWAFRCQVLRGEGLIHAERDEALCDRLLGAASEGAVN